MQFDALRTRIVRGGTTSANVLDLRSRRIREAVGWEPGPSVERQRVYPVYHIAEGVEGGFLKPGKESARISRDPEGSPSNIYDMRPYVGKHYSGATFQDAWSYLSAIAVVNFDDFKAVLTLLYRMILFTDHAVEGPKVRYLPQGGVRLCIATIDERVRQVLPPGGLVGLLSFLDLLGWNEDVKYHADRQTGAPRFDSAWKYRPATGPETFLGTCIRVTYEVSRFVRDAAPLASAGKPIDFNVPYGLLQQMARTRGVCTPTQGQLVDWLSPLITSE